MNVMKTETGRESRAKRRQEIQRHVSEKCISCGICTENCQLLRTYGTPRSMVQSYFVQRVQDFAIPFECSLCNLCSSGCPEQVDPRNMFLEMRREAVLRGKGLYPEHAGLLNFERRGTSQRFSWYGLPQNCDTVFFPGCALPGTRPHQTKKAFELLQNLKPNLGIVLDCCTKPSHDLGRQDYFLAMFGEMRDYLLGQGILQVVVACPNCYAVFRDYAPELVTSSLYEVLAEGEKKPSGRNWGKVVVHDPCSIRNTVSVQDAVRKLAVLAGVDVGEMAHNRSEAFCCGEGGGVAALAPNFAAAWAESCVEDAAGYPMMTSCAGCANFLGKHTTTIHILDLLLDPEAAMRGKVPVSRAPITYLNRLRVKRHFRHRLPVTVSRERNFFVGKKSIGISGKLSLSGIFRGIILSFSRPLSLLLPPENLRVQQNRCRSMIAGKTVGLIIPARNEELSLPGVLNGIPLEIDTVIVVDNGSTDNTALVARLHGAQVVAEPSAGYGRACLAGLAALQNTSPDFVAFVDADGSDDLSCLPALLLSLVKGEADLVLSWRRPFGPGALSPQQRWGNFLVTRLMRLIWRHKYHDLGPMRALTWQALMSLRMADRDFGWTVEMQIRALKRGLRVIEIPVPYRARKLGRSKISRTVKGTLRAGSKMLWVILREAFGN